MYLSYFFLFYMIESLNFLFLFFQMSHSVNIQIHSIFTKILGERMKMRATQNLAFLAMAKPRHYSPALMRIGSETQLDVL